jgi:hypothetical protein
MKARKFFTWLGMVAVTAVAGLISYRHQSELALHNGQPAALAAVWPACVDGLVMATGIAIATDRAEGLRPRLWALFGFWVGVVVSVLTNWAATNGGPIAHAVSAFPAIAFLITVESLSAKPRPVKGVHTTDIPADQPANLPVETVEVSTVLASPKPPRKAPAAVTAAAKVAAAAKRLPDGTPAQIAARAGVSESTARRHLAALEPVPVASTFASAPAQTNGHDVLAEVSL